MPHDFVCHHFLSLQWTFKSYKALHFVAFCFYLPVDTSTNHKSFCVTLWIFFHSGIFVQETSCIRHWPLSAYWLWLRHSLSLSCSGIHSYMVKRIGHSNTIDSKQPDQITGLWLCCIVLCFWIYCYTVIPTKPRFSKKSSLITQDAQINHCYPLIPQ